MFKKITLCSALVSVVALTGCTVHNTTSSDNLIDIYRVEKFVTPGKTTLAEVRELIGTPGLAGKTLQGKDFVGFAVVGERSYGEAAARGFGDILTLGLVDDDERHFTQKNIYFVLDDNKVVQDIKFNGHAYIMHMDSKNYNLCQRQLNEKELRSTHKLTKDEIINSWKKEIIETKPSSIVTIAEEKKKKLEELAYDDVFYPICGHGCYLQHGAFEAFGKYTNEELNLYGGRQPNDGSKKALLGL